MTSTKFYNAALTVSTVSKSKKDKNGKPFMTARGMIARGESAIERTIVARGAAMDAIKKVVKKGATVRLRGFYDKVANEDGTKGEYFVVTGLARELKAA